MRTKLIGIAMTSLLAPVVFGQAASQTTQTRTFTINHAATVQNFQEIANVVRLITEIKDLMTDNDQRSLSVSGAPEQVGLAEWLVKELDQPLGTSVSPGILEYKGLPERGDDGKMANTGVARILYVPHATTVQDFQEAANAVRTVSEIRRVGTYNAAKAVVVRGTPEQIAMAAWAFDDLDQSLNAQAVKPSASVQEYTVGSNDLMRVFYLENAKTVQDFQEIANLVRTVAEIRRAFTLNPSRALVVRGTPGEIAMVEWLVTQLDKPAGAAQTLASDEYRTPGAVDDVVRVFHLTHAPTVQQFQQEATAIRTSAQIRRVFTYNTQRAVAVRGTVSQLALAERLAQDLDTPAVK